MQIKMRFLTQSKKMGVILTEKKKRKDVQIPRKYFRIVRDMGIVLAKYFEDTDTLCVPPRNRTGGEKSKKVCDLIFST